MKALLPVVFGTAALLSGAALADSTNTITFKGEITEQTCSVTVNGSSAHPVVLLPTISKSDLKDPASSAGLTTFTMGVSGCSVDSSNLEIKTLLAPTLPAAGTLPAAVRLKTLSCNYSLILQAARLST